MQKVVTRGDMMEDKKWFKIDTNNTQYYVKASSLGLALILVENGKWDYAEIEAPSIADVKSVNLADKGRIARLIEEGKINYAGSD